MAEIFMRNVNVALGEVDLMQALALVFHQPPFRTQEDPLWNFKIHLFRDKNGRQTHRGQGALTLPSEDLAMRFLSIYGQIPRPRLACEMGGNLILFAPSTKDARPDVLHSILSTPFMDAALFQEREARDDRLDRGVNFTMLSFGWQCRDDTFSPEWNAPASIMGQRPRLRFDDDSNEIIVSLGSNQDVDDFMGMFSRDTELCIIFKYSRVESLAIDRHDGVPAILFTFPSPPAFERWTSHPMFDSEPTRHRLSYLSPCHKSVSPYTSLAMRLVCADANDLQSFLAMSRIANLPKPFDMTSPSRPKNLFSSFALERVSNWNEGFDWPIAFQLSALVANLLLDPVELWSLHIEIEQIASDSGSQKASEILRSFNSRLRTWGYSEDDETPPLNIRDCLEMAKQDTTPLHLALRSSISDPGSFDCYHATLTPTGMLLDGPLPDQSNRVIRQYAENSDAFLRVNFTDEEKLNYRWDQGVQGSRFVDQRVGGALKDGLWIAGRKFDFLAYSSSALKEHAVWFCKQFYHEPTGSVVTAEDIRRGLGDFSHLELQPARYGARMSQAFTATEPSITLDLGDEVPIHPDIERNGSNFTDGIGDISKALAKRITRSLEKRHGRHKFFVKPSAFQFRMGGFKGVLAINPSLTGAEIVLRKSQSKFTSPSFEIEIAQCFYRAKPAYLNRPLIMVLETLGVPIPVFVELQDQAVKEVETATDSLLACSKFLDSEGFGAAYGLGGIFAQLDNIGVGFVHERPYFVLGDHFIDISLEFARNHVLRVIKHKARIPIKGSYTLVGVVDTSGYLGPNEVFVCIQNRKEKPFCLKGRVLVTRSPQIHPGDVQMVEAIGLPPPDSPFIKERWTNCLVFSSTGERSVPSMLAGGDLDGDEYNVILHVELHPSRCYPPAEYPPAEIWRLDHPCTINDLSDWVVKFINADIMGLVSSQFLILADQSDLMCRDPNCLVLAELASKAVDFAKSGTPVSREDIPKLPSKARPDWAVGESGRHAKQNKNSYESQRAIGHLFRRIDLTDTERHAAREARRQEKGMRRREEAREEDLLVKALENLNVQGPARNVMEHPISQALWPLLCCHIDVGSSVPVDRASEALVLYEAYAAELRQICVYNSLNNAKPLTEEEALVGTIASKTTQPRRRQTLITQLRRNTEGIVKRIRVELIAPSGEMEDSLLWAWVAWQISVGLDETFGAKSFGIIALGAIFEILRKLEDQNSSII